MTAEMTPVFRYVDQTIITGEVSDGDRKVFLTEKESLVLGVLVRAKGRVVPHELFTRDLYPIIADEPDNPKETLNQFIHRLRVKLEPFGIRIETKQGLGWSFPIGQLAVDWKEVKL